MVEERKMNFNNNGNKYNYYRELILLWNSKISRNRLGIMLLKMYMLKNDKEDSSNFFNLKINFNVF